jgi:hypothetical protein
MLTDPSARRRLRLTLIAISLATIPCYCVGLFAASLAPERGALPPATLTFTPTISATATASATFPASPTASASPFVAPGTDTPTITPTDSR